MKISGRNKPVITILESFAYQPLIRQVQKKMPPRKKDAGEGTSNADTENVSGNKISKKKEEIQVRINIFKKIKETLRCGKCQKMPRPKMLMYSYGENLTCEECYGNRALLEPIDGDSLSNKLLKEELPFECKNTDFGCDVISMPDDLKIHEEQQCNFFEVHCAVLSCTEETFGNLNYADHLEQQHADLTTVTLDDNDNTFKLQFEVTRNPAPRQQQQQQVRKR